MTNVGEIVEKAVSKTDRYKRMKSEPGGIHDQMNCMWYFMKGYQSVHDESDSSVVEPSDGKICVTSYKTRLAQKIRMYVTGDAQWQIYAIEDCARSWNLTLVDLFRVSEFVYSYVPSYTGSYEDFKRLENLGIQTADFGDSPMAVFEMGKLKKINELKAQIDAICSTMGKTADLKLKNKEN